MTTGNTQHKDRLFTYMYGSSGNDQWLLSLYNAVRGTDYTDASAIDITTIETVMYLSMHNDVSFVIADEMNLYEQQSTYNPNMPLRMLQYLASLYEKYITQNKLNKYSSTQLSLPVPKLVVFYNGTTDKPDEMMLALSDSFPPGADADVEVKVKMININLGKNPKLLEDCKTLGEYSWLVNEIRAGVAAKKDIGVAIDEAIDNMPDDFEIKPFLVAHKAEVRGMLLTEYNEAKTMELFKEEGREEGRVEGREEGRAEGIDIGTINTYVALVEDGVIDTATAARRLGVTESQFRDRLETWIILPVK